MCAYLSSYIPGTALTRGPPTFGGTFYSSVAAIPTKDAVQQQASRCTTHLRAGCAIKLTVRWLDVVAASDRTATGAKTSPSLRWCRQKGGDICHTSPVQGRAAPPSLSSPTTPQHHNANTPGEIPRVRRRHRQRLCAGSSILHSVPLTVAEARTAVFIVFATVLTEAKTGKYGYHQGRRVQCSSFVAFPQPGGD